MPHEPKRFGKNAQIQNTAQQVAEITTGTDKKKMKQYDKLFGSDVSIIKY